MSKEGKLAKLKYKLEDHMLLGSIYDNVMMKTKYREEKLAFLYNVMVGQKHRMLFYSRLKKKYLDKCTSERGWEAKEKKFNADTIWLCWLQGMENAPELVKQCYASLRRNIPDKDIVLLDESNIFEYVTMPEYIVEKWKKGIIGPAHFTDLVRLELLTTYGGYWIDATVFCTDGSMLQMIDEYPLFMYSFYYFGFNPEIMETNNWFIYGTTNNNILCLTKELLYCYWKDMDRAVNYFIFHLFMTIACEYYEEEYREMPIVSQVEPHILATYIGEKYDEKKFNLLKSRTGFHKLSTRFSSEETGKKGSFYEYLISGRLG